MKREEKRRHHWRVSAVRCVSHQRHVRKMQVESAKKKTGKETVHGYRTPLMKVTEEWKERRDREIKGSEAETK